MRKRCKGLPGCWAGAADSFSCNDYSTAANSFAIYRSRMHGVIIVGCSLMSHIKMLATGVALLLSLPVIPGCAFRRIVRSKNTIYLQADTTRHLPAQGLSVFAPRRHQQVPNKKVLVFIHGGNWTSGHRSLYNWFGSRLARKGVVAVVIDYPKSPVADYRVMATYAAQAVKWVSKNIAPYGGNPDSIFVSGHSAGGHLATLIATDESYFRTAGIVNPLKGVILIDAAGLDMYGYLQNGGMTSEPSYAATFSNEPKVWKDATPLYHLRTGLPPMLIFRGGRTYPSIIESNEKFVAALRKLGYTPKFEVIEGKKHIPMITQFLNSRNRRYEEMLQFMED